MGFFLKSDKATHGNIDTDPQKIDALLSRGVTEVIDREELRKLLSSGKKLRVKLGIDPTSPNVHLGRAVTLLKLKDFEELGHQIVFIIGDFTGVIGDTSDKESERPMLHKETIEQNLKQYREQAGKILKIDHVEVRKNSEWLSSLTFSDIGELADKFSVADFIARENIKKRLDTGSRVSLREVLYPLMQGYDSVAVKADVEIGGTDQRFNLLAGRALQPLFKQPSQQILMTGLIRGLDGRKMSSSWGNTINLLDSANDMYGKVMSVTDDLMEEYFIYATRVPVDEISRLIEEYKSGGKNPKEIKMRLAREIVTMFHSKESAEKAEKSFGTPEAAVVIKTERGIDAEIIIREKIVPSMSEWKRLIDQGAIERDGQVLTEYRTELDNSVEYKIGKHRFVKIEIK